MIDMGNNTSCLLTKENKTKGFNKPEYFTTTKRHKEMSD